MENSKDIINYLKSGR